MDDIIRQIESAETTARLGIHSGYRQLIRALVADSPVRLLRGWLRDHPEDKFSIFARVATLAEERIDPRYEHPSDTAFSIYLVVLASTDDDLYQAAREIVGALPNLWWTRKMFEARKVAPAELLEQIGGGRAAFSGLRPTSQSIDSLIPAPASYGNRRILPVMSSRTSGANTTSGDDASTTSNSGTSVGSLAAA